jgi:hypothetical protein
MKDFKYYTVKDGYRMVAMHRHGNWNHVYAGEKILVHKSNDFGVSRLNLTEGGSKVYKTEKEAEQAETKHKFTHRK